MCIANVKWQPNTNQGMFKYCYEKVTLVCFVILIWHLPRKQVSALPILGTSLSAGDIFEKSRIRIGVFLWNLKNSAPFSLAKRKLLPKASSLTKNRRPSECRTYRQQDSRVLPSCGLLSYPSNISSTYLTVHNYRIVGWLKKILFCTKKAPIKKNEEYRLGVA